jgi:alpha-galactosidase
MLGGDPRDENGHIIPNKHFPDMKAFTDYLHANGFKAGIYSSPGPLTCSQYAGSMDFEANDAKQYADWGFDLLKYDWCSYGKVAGKSPALAEMKKPYELMGPLVKQQNRDIIFNLCQYGMGDVWQWGADVDAQSWRTSGDLGYSLDNLFNVARENINHRAWQGPGHWNDPDYVQIGYVGNIRSAGKRGEDLIPVPLTPTEQYSFMSLWCLSAAPLVYSGDVTKLDEFTLNVLCNAEVIEVNQDPLGQAAAPADLGEDTFLLVKDMADGSKAVGLCNGSEGPQTLTAHWGAMGVSGRQRVRDLWRQEDEGEFEARYTAEVPRHGVKFIRLWPAK